jgi:hypothetical protein
VCVTLAKIENITDRESLGVISVQLEDVANATLTALEENAYSDGITERQVTGALGIYSVNKSTDNNAGETPAETPSETTPESNEDTNDDQKLEPTSYNSDSNIPVDADNSDGVTESGDSSTKDTGTNPLLYVGIIVCVILIIVNFYILVRKIKKIKSEKMVTKNSETSTESF